VAGRHVGEVVAAADAGAGILHVDMDAFYASVELLDRPELVGKPIAVAHDSGRSVVSSASYEARSRGVRSAMPVSQAKRLCPELTLVDPHFEKYSHYSKQVMGIFRDVTPLVEPISVDEAFLDVRGALRLFGPPRTIAALIRQRVRAETGLPCSVGIGATKFIAKLASQRAKPDGVLLVPAAATLAFLHPLPLGALWGVGPSTKEKLERLGLRTVRDIAMSPVDLITAAVGSSMGAHLHRLANGVDDREIQVTRVEKSVGHETTFAEDIADERELRRVLLDLSHRVGERLRHHHLAGRTIALKLRYSDFTTISRSHTITDPTDVSRRIYEEAAGVFAKIDRAGRAVRLIGVRVEQLEAAGGSGALWNEDEEWEQLDGVTDSVNARFGSALLGPASLLGGRSRAPRRDADARRPAED
jgi:DNA polymerase-4